MWYSDLFIIFILGFFYYCLISFLMYFKDRLFGLFRKTRKVKRRRRAGVNKALLQSSSSSNEIKKYDSDSEINKKEVKETGLMYNSDPEPSIEKLLKKYE